MTASSAFRNTNKNSFKMATCISLLGVHCLAQAADVEDPNVRIQELEQQMKYMAEQLKTLQELVSQQQNVAKEPPQSTSPSAPSAQQGAPVLASFKNGLTFSDTSGDWSLRLYARTQLDYKAYPDGIMADTFSLRRARLGTIATFMEDFSMRIEAEFAADTNNSTYARLNDAWLDYTHYKGAMLRVGQFYTWHGLERVQAAMDLNFMERSTTDYLFGAVFDRGVMLHGAPVNGLYYNLTYVNGTGPNADESNDYPRSDRKDISLRVAGNLAQWVGWEDSLLHIGGTYLTGTEAPKTSNVLPKLRTEGRGVTYFEVTNPSLDDIDRNIYAVETAIAHGPVKFQSEYVNGTFTMNDQSRDATAWYASLQWLVTGESYATLYKGPSFTPIQPKNNFRLGKAGWGALEVGARYSRFDAADFRDMLTNTQRNTYGASAWTVGAKWVLNPRAQVQLNYIRTDFDTSLTLGGKVFDAENALNMRMQYDF